MSRSTFRESIRIVAPVLILAVGVMCFVVFGQRQPPPPRDNPKRPAELVETETIANHQGPLPIHTSGEVVPYRVVQLAAEVVGQIEFKHPDCRSGGLVTKDTTLVRIDSSNYDLEVARLTSELKQAKSDSDQLDVEEANNNKLIDTAKSQVHIQNELYDRVRSTTGTSVKDVLQANLDYINAKTNLITLENQQRVLQKKRVRLEHAIGLVQAKLDLARLDQKRTTIVAPINGMIVRSDVEKNSFVQKGTEIAVIYDTSTVEIKCNVLLEEMAWIWQQPIQTPPGGERVQLSGRVASLTGMFGMGLRPQTALPALPAFHAVAEGDGLKKFFQVPPTDVAASLELVGHRFTWKGRLDRFEGTGLDEKTRTVPLRIKVDRPEKATVEPIQDQRPGQFVRLPVLFRGMHVKIRILAKPPIEFVRVPEKALRKDGTIWRFRKTKTTDEFIYGKLDIVAVRPAVIIDGIAIIPKIDSGLSADETIVVSPLQMSWQGMPVRMKNPKKEARS